MRLFCTPHWLFPHYSYSLVLCSCVFLQPGCRASWFRYCPPSSKKSISRHDHQTAGIPRGDVSCVYCSRHILGFLERGKAVVAVSHSSTLLDFSSLHCLTSVHFTASRQSSCSSFEIQEWFYFRTMSGSSCLQCSLFSVHPGDWSCSCFTWQMSANFTMTVLNFSCNMVIRIPGTFSPEMSCSLRKLQGQCRVV